MSERGGSPRLYSTTDAADADLPRRQSPRLSPRTSRAPSPSQRTPYSRTTSPSRRSPVSPTPGSSTRPLSPTPGARILPVSPTPGLSINPIFGSPEEVDNTGTTTGTLAVLSTPPGDFLTPTIRDNVQLQLRAIADTAAITLYEQKCASDALHIANMERHLHAIQVKTEEVRQAHITVLRHGATELYATQ